MEAKKGFKAVSKNLPISPSKVRPIADNVRRKPVLEALAILESLPHKGAGYLAKVIMSAQANAGYVNPGLDEEMLYVAELLVDGGPSRKTIWPRSRGRADRQIKRSSHISVVLDKRDG
ncbi:MAG: 50S ribosomal protein L22 [Spirochaeta sp. LUC14_002_19_P3]|nr:MAG: 50S ribosomal protein L22 [Spirochaeta sp. LUC14_002_19_P3]